MSSSERNPEARAMLLAVLPVASDFDAFCLDYFHDAERNFASGMDRQAKTSMLLQLHSHAEIEDALRRKAPEQLAAYQVQHAKAVPRVSHPHDPALADRVFGDADPLRYVDRSKQFEYVCGIHARNRHEVVLIPGSHGEAHAFFLARIERAVPKTAPVHIVLARWPRVHDMRRPRHPTTRTEMLTALARALGSPSSHPNDLPGLFGHHLRSHRLLVLHPIVDRCLDEKTLHSYYTEWLPELCAPHRGQHFAHFIQPIAWSPLNFLWRLLAKDRRATAGRALNLIVRLKTDQRESLSIEETTVLAPIEESHVLDYLKHIGWPQTSKPEEHDRLRGEFAAEVLSGAASSEEILRRICEKMRDDL